MPIYTSYYAGEIIGEPVSISLYPPKDWKGKHLPLFAPTPELLKWWKSSLKDTASQFEYKRQFREILQSRQQLIELWVNRLKGNPTDITLCCYEKTGDFCHRHQVGEEIVQKYLSELWSGEVSTFNTQQSQLIKPIHPTTYPPQILRLIEKCHNLGYPVKCDRTEYDYYQISLGDEDLGVWTPIGVLGALSKLTQPLKSDRFLPSAKPEQTTAPVQSQAVNSSPSLIRRLGKLEGQELQKIQDWCNSIKHLMKLSVSQYADGRMELHLRRFVSLTSSKSGNKTEVKLVDASRYPGSERIEELGEKLLPDFHQALVLFYPAGTQIKVHRDSPAYASGAAQINVIGQARFSISGCQDPRRLESYSLEEGDCIAFDNKQPHGIERVKSDRTCICFFKLKPEYLITQKVEQLALI